MAGKRELVPGLSASRTPSPDGKKFTYSIENNSNVAYLVTIDISQSKNVL